jgi:chaperonin GroES
MINMATKIQPLADYVLAQQEEAETKTASGLYLMEKSQEKPKIAKVLNVGKDVKTVKKGDRVIYKSYSTSDIKVGSEEYILIKEEDLLATVS